MNNFQPFGPKDGGTLPEGDFSFIGVDERPAPQQLPAGYVASARNKRFRNGRCATRDGITLLPWLPVDGKTPWSEVYGGAVFNDPNQSGQWILVAADGGIWKTRPNFVAQPVPLPAGTNLTAATFRRLVQTAAGMLLLRGNDLADLVMQDLEEGFKPVQQTQQWDVEFDHSNDRVIFAGHNLLIGDPVRFAVSAAGPLPGSVTAGVTYYVLDVPDGDTFTLADAPAGNQIKWNTGAGDVALDPGLISVLDGADPIPPAEDGIFTGNRAVLVESDENGPTDLVAVSDIGDPTRYAKLGQTFRVNQGDSYKLVTVRIFNEDTLVCFKEGNVKKVTGFSGDLSGAQGPLNVTEAYGAICAGAVTAYGNEIYWLSSELRIANLTLTQLNQEQGTDVSLSDPLVKTFGRINAAYVKAARTQVHDGFLFVALPFDEAELLDDTELVQGASYSGSPATLTVNGLTAGKVYRYDQGTVAGAADNDSYLVNGTETVWGPGTFTAQGSSVTLYGVAAGASTATIYQVLAQGCNTGVAVYDFLNQAWAGTDEAAGVTVVKDWLKFTYGGRPRLGFIGADGWLHLYGDSIGSNGPEDEKLVDVGPYVDVIVYDYSKLGPGDTLKFGAGTTITATNSATNSGNNWGIAGNAGGQNLWQDSNGNGGFNQSSTSPWLIGFVGLQVEQIADGIRVYSSSSLAEVVKVNGTLMVNDGVLDWAFVDTHGGEEIQGVAIDDLVVTRAYMCNRIFMQQPAGMVKRYRSAAAQIATWSPNYTVTTIVQGQGTDNQVAPSQQFSDAAAPGAGVTMDRTKYFAPLGAPDYDVSNVNDDFFKRGRQDYSVVATNMGILLGSGVDFDALQEYVHRVDVNESGLWLQLRIENTDGRLELLATAMEGEEGMVLSGPQAN